MTRDKALEVSRILYKIENIEGEISLVEGLVMHEELDEERANVIVAYLTTQLEIAELELGKL